MARTTPELAPPLQASAPHQRKGVWPLRMIQRATGPIHGGSSVESGFEPTILRSRGRDLTTRPPRPLIGKRHAVWNCSSGFKSFWEEWGVGQGSETSSKESHS
ncbi:hypothetical protein AVEN_20276-1 [Araneus ventricosus]|uniref:Uncharacterized protein n=1 Tax=Araneus ventricosus TaxID=182803 RepID=A0A4Y2JIJ2_ARAVE|nr:hypothetical protein AVEN_20276-1 [Araneus ventricosus]